MKFTEDGLAGMLWDGSQDLAANERTICLMDVMKLFRDDYLEKQTWKETLLEDNYRLATAQETYRLFSTIERNLKSIDSRTHNQAVEFKEQITDALHEDMQGIMTSSTIEYTPAKKGVPEQAKIMHDIWHNTKTVTYHDYTIETPKRESIRLSEVMKDKAWAKFVSGLLGTKEPINRIIKVLSEVTGYSSVGSVIWTGLERKQHPQRMITFGTNTPNLHFGAEYENVPLRYALGVRM